MAIAFWCVILLVSLLAEYHTNALVAIFVGLGSAIGLALVLGGLPFWITGLAMLGASIGGISLLRPLALKRFPRHQYEVDMTLPTRTNMTHLTGQVEEAVGNESHPGRVRIQGESWRAVTDWPEPLPIGQTVTVDRVYGTTLWVHPA